MSAGFKDCFSQHARQYRDARPDYPVGLFQQLRQLVATSQRAWDCGTGNGQAALTLAEYFNEVVATDPSFQQIERAGRHPRVRYCVTTAEDCCLTGGCVQLVVAAQAFHWFDPGRFHREVYRVTADGGVLAVWCYQLPRVSAEIDACVARFYTEVVGPYWLPERRHVDDGYRSLPFPYDEIAMPSFSIRKQWRLQQFLDYLATWSATRRYIGDRGVDPLPVLTGPLAELWGDASSPRWITWPLRMRVGRKPV